MALTANHCLETFEARDVLLQSRSGSTYRIRSITPHPTPSYLFPSGDLMRLDLESSVILPGNLPPLSMLPFEHIVPGQRLSIWGFGGSCGNDCAVERMATVQETTDGVWLRNLITVDADRETFCLSDSGGPAFLYQGGEWKLVGLISGKMDLLTGADLSCENKRVLLTAVEPYAGWIDGAEKPSLQTETDTTDLGILCQRPFAASAGLVYSLLLDLINSETELTQLDKIELLKSCKNVKEIFQKRLTENPSFTFTSPVVLQWIDGFEKIETFELPEASEKDREILRRMPLLRHEKNLMSR